MAQHCTPRNNIGINRLTRLRAQAYMRMESHRSRAIMKTSQRADMALRPQPMRRCDPPQHCGQQLSNR
eukprot:scaffold426_cov219-Amphora_coffeaeformis.AAC.11